MALSPGLLSKLGGSLSRCDGLVDVLGGDQASLLSDGTGQQCLERDVVERCRVPVWVTSGVLPMFSLFGGVSTSPLPMASSSAAFLRSLGKFFYESEHQSRVPYLESEIQEHE